MTSGGRRQITVEDNTGVIVIVAAHNEADRIGATLVALVEAFPGSPVWVADDGSTDATAAIAQAAGAEVISGERRAGKGAALTRAARTALAARSGDATRARIGSALEDAPGEPIVLLCDGDLGESASRLAPLVGAVSGGADLAVAAFRSRAGGGFGVVVAFARWTIRRRCGLATRAPLSGQRAMRASLLGELLPFAHGYGIEVGMTIDAVRARARVTEVELDLAHRATGRTLGGFLHRGRQLLDVGRAYVARR
jgi:glycosyltransferase involved in cell wall biosynthesis